MRQKAGDCGNRNGPCRFASIRSACLGAAAPNPGAILEKLGSPRPSIAQILALLARSTRNRRHTVCGVVGGWGVPHDEGRLSSLCYGLRGRAGASGRCAEFAVAGERAHGTASIAGRRDPGTDVAGADDRPDPDDGVAHDGSADGRPPGGMGGGGGGMGGGGSPPPCVAEFSKMREDVQKKGAGRQAGERKARSAAKSSAS